MESFWKFFSEAFLEGPSRESFLRGDFYGLHLRGSFQASLLLSASLKDRYAACCKKGTLLEVCSKECLLGVRLPGWKYSVLKEPFLRVLLTG